MWGCPSSAVREIQTASDAAPSAKDTAAPSFDAGNPLDPDAGAKDYVKTGSVHVGLIPALGATPAQGYLSAYFLDARFDRTAGCTSLPLGGGCSKSVCTGQAAPQMPAKRSVGKLQYAVRGVSQEILRDADFLYERSFDGTTVPFAAGDEVAFQAAGDIAPGFDSSVQMEAQARIDTPLPGLDGAWTVGRAAATDVRFTGGSGIFTLQLVFGAARITVECSVPAASGGFSIPGSAFTALAPGTEGFVTIASTNGKTQEIVDDWKLVIESHTTARSSDGRPIPTKVIAQ